jgi:hypothetical protein
MTALSIILVFVLHFSSSKGKMTFQSFFMLMTNQPFFFASSWSFDDPAKATGSEEEVFAVFRRVRDEIGNVFGAYAAGINLGAQLYRSSAGRETLRWDSEKSCSLLWACQKGVSQRVSQP